MTQLTWDMLLDELDVAARVGAEGYTIPQEDVSSENQAKLKRLGYKMAYGIAVNNTPIITIGPQRRNT